MQARGHAELAFELRQKSRLARALWRRARRSRSCLPRGKVLRDGDLLAADDGRVVRVIAAREERAARRVRADAACLRAAPTTSATATRRSQMGDGFLRIARITCWRRCCDGLGASVVDDRGAVRAGGGRVRRRRASSPCCSEDHGIMHGPMAHTATSDPPIRAMPIDTMHRPRSLRLLQLASPTLPVGAYSYSQGLEAAIEAASSTTTPAARGWIADVLEYVVARWKLPLLCA